MNDNNCYQMLQATNHSGIKCLEHPNQEITNMCLYFDCLKPLCPDCVQVHTKFHDRQEIESWKHCINKSSRSLRSTLSSLQGVYDSLNQYKPFRSVQTIQTENVRRLHEIKAKYHQMLNEAFANHEKEVRLLIRNCHKTQGPDTQQLKTAIEEVEKILMKLGHTQTVIPALKKSLVIDYKALLNHFENLKHHKSTATIQEVFVFEDINTTQKFKSILQEMGKSPIYRESPYSNYSFPVVNADPGNFVLSSHAQEPIRLWDKDYFHPDCRGKFLHFFVPLQNQLKLLSLENAQFNSRNWQTITFKIQDKDEIPIYFNSLITPSGAIYLSGGNRDSQRCKQIYKYNPQKKMLELVSQMVIARSSHSLCYASNAIYLIGGFSESGEVTKQCQIFNLSNLTCSRIAPLNYPSANSCAANYNNERIYKFGGALNKYENNCPIEMYEIRSNRWVVVSIQFGSKLELLSFSAAIQANQKQMIVFGGYDNSMNQKPQNLCYLVTVKGQKVVLKNCTNFALPYAQGFWNSNPIMQKRKIFALQNISDSDNDLTALADARRLLTFDGHHWNCH